jgi:hypothetical protein
VGFCPEEESCPMIMSAVKSYSEKFHRGMKESLESDFQKNLRELVKKS